MGMFDKPKYLTGEEGFATTGDVFWLHNAKIDGFTGIGNEQRAQAKLLVSFTRDGDKLVVWTGGRGITNQVRSMDASDRSAMPIEVRLDQIPAKSADRKPTFILSPADAPTINAITGDSPEF